MLDATGVLRLPTRRRPWAPRGQTALLPYHDPHDRSSALAARTVSPTRQPLGRYRRWQPQNFKAAHVAECLRALLRHLRGHVILLWDRGRSHRGPAIEAVRQAYPRLHVEEFPAYAPELNPVEQVWNNFQGHTANSLLRATRDLCHRLRNNVRRGRRRQEKLRGCMRASKRPSPP